MHQHFLGVGREIAELADRRALLREARFAVLGALRGLAIVTSVRMPRHAFFAVAAKNRRARNDVIAGLQISNRLADLLDHARGLVSEDGRRGMRVESFYEM